MKRVGLDCRHWIGLDWIGLDCRYWTERLDWIVGTGEGNELSVSVMNMTMSMNK